MVTDADIDALKKFFVDRYEFDQKVRNIIKEEVSHLPTRDEFFKETAKIYIYPFNAS